MWIENHVAAIGRDIKTVSESLREQMPDNVRAAVENELLLLKTARSLLATADIKKVQGEFSIGRMALDQRRAMKRHLALMEDRQKRRRE